MAYSISSIKIISYRWVTITPAYYYILFKINICNTTHFDFHISVFKRVNDISCKIFT